MKLCAIDYKMQNGHLKLGNRLMVKNPFIGLKSRHLNSEDDFGMKTTSNRSSEIFPMQIMLFTMTGIN